jgi:hypothetical protein
MTAWSIAIATDSARSSAITLDRREIVANWKRAVRAAAAVIVFAGSANLAAAAPFDWRPCNEVEWNNAELDIHNQCVGQYLEPCGMITECNANDSTGAVVAWGYCYDPGPGQPCTEMPFPGG